MSEEDFFQELLDEASGDSAARFLFADWLAERGDWRTSGYQWMAMHGKHPEEKPSPTGTTWDWWSTVLPSDPNRHNSEYLEPIVFELLEGYAYHSDWKTGSAYREFFTREAAEEELIRALYYHFHQTRR